MQAEIYELWETWKTNDFFDEEIRRELALLNPLHDAVEIEDRFYRNLEFGTGGIRGLMGAGTNRMNQYTVCKATKGLGKYLISCYNLDVCAGRGVAIAYDTRINSREFAEAAANILTSFGIKVYLFLEARPTPQLSYSIKLLDCVAGIVITASHNPKEYNGYKVYDEHGCQLVPEQAKKAAQYMENEDCLSSGLIKNDSLMVIIDTTNEFVASVIKQSLNRDGSSKEKLKIVYTPLHGTGNITVGKVLAADGFSSVAIVPKQKMPDGFFPTVSTPNPEDSGALALGIEWAKDIQADIVLGTDPDCDRVGVAVGTGKGYKLLTGNQIGVLLTDYILNNKNISELHKPAIIKTIVTSELGAEIARKKGVSVFSTLTGFKFIGEKITQFEKAFLNQNKEQDYTFVFGYEESCGYLMGTYARDKDAVVACMLICEMAAAYKAIGKTLLDCMDELYREYGYYYDAQDSFTLKGKDGLEQISAIMQRLRAEEPIFTDTKEIIDYNELIMAEPGFGVLPKENLLKYILADTSWVAIRPSGTESKLKVYYSIKGANENQAKERFIDIQKRINSVLTLEV